MSSAQQSDERNTTDHSAEVKARRAPSRFVRWVSRMRRTAFSGGMVLFLPLVAGGAALAAIPDEGGMFTGCYHQQTGALRVIDAGAGAGCDPSEQQISWSQTGPQGAPGAQGPQGEAGPQGHPGMSGYTYVSARSEFTPAARKFVMTLCPAGLTALGGGGYIFPTLADPNRNAAPIALTASEPIFRQFHTKGPDDIDGWSVVAQAMNPYPQNWHVTAWAICARALP